jgi:hypothetical protein
MARLKSRIQVQSFENSHLITFTTDLESRGHIMLSFPPELARAFACMAHQYVNSSANSPQDQQAVAYVSRVSIEQSLKSALERAGYSEEEIRSHGHNLGSLLKELGKCTVSVLVTCGVRQPVSASRIRSKTIYWDGMQTTLGEIIDNLGTSSFPAEYRYGQSLIDYPAEVLSKAARAVSQWVDEHWCSLSRAP